MIRKNLASVVATFGLATVVAILGPAALGQGQDPPYTGTASSPLLPQNLTYYSYMHLRATASDVTS